MGGGRSRRCSSDHLCYTKKRARDGSRRQIRHAQTTKKAALLDAGDLLCRDPQKDEPSANPYSKRLALGELLGAAGLAQTDLLTFDFTSVAGHETGVGENALEAGVVVDEGARDAVTDGAGLADSPPPQTLTMMSNVSVFSVS